MKKLKNRFATAILAAAMTITSAPLTLFAQESPAIPAAQAASTLDLDEKTTARYSSVRISFTPETGHTYKIQKKNEAGAFEDLEGAADLTTGSFIDENAGTGKMPSYKIIDTTDTENVQETAEFTSVKTGLEALAAVSTLAWIDPKTDGSYTVFDGTNAVEMDAETTAKVAALSEGTVIAKVQLNSIAQSGQSGAFLGIKSNTANRFFGYRSSTSAPFAFGYELTDQNKCQCLGTNASNWSLQAGTAGHTVVYRAPADCVADRLCYFYDGADGLSGAQYPNIFKDAKFNGFLTKTTPMNTIAIGAVKGTDGSTTCAWNGEIHYVLITSELLSEAECAAVSLANAELNAADIPDLEPDQPAPEDIVCSVKGGVFRNTITWTGDRTATIERDGTVIAENAVSPYTDTPEEKGNHTYKITVGTGAEAKEFSQSVSTGLEETAVLYHDFKKDAGSNPTVFDGTRLPYDLLANADADLKTKVGNISGGAVIIRFKSNTTTNPYNLFFSHVSGVYAQSDWPKDNAVGAIEGRVPANKRVRFDLTGGAKAELGSVSDGVWHTVAFSSADAQHLSEADTFTVTMDGSRVFGYPNMADFAGLFSRMGGAAEEVLIGGVRKAAGTDASAFAGLFNGEIDYAAVVDENLTNAELIELTKADEAPLAKSALFDASGNKHWVAAGGGLASTGNDVLGYHESYYKIFHMQISLGYNANGGYDLAQLNRQRYVINRSVPGQTIKDIDENYDSIINGLGPRAVLLMLDGNEALSDQQIKDSLKSILKKDLAAKRFTLIQIPPVKGATSRDLKALADEVVADVLARDYPGCENSIVIVDHEALFASESEDDKCFDANGNLNARGHWKVADQLCTALGVGHPGETNESTLSKYTFTPLASLKEETPIFTVSSDSVQASIQADGVYYGVLEMDGQKTRKPFVNKSVLFDDLDANTAFSLTIENQDGAAVYKKKTGTTGRAAVSDVQDYEELSDLQKLVKQYTLSDEPTTWLFVGDSITHGVYTNGYTGVPDVFERYIHEDLSRPDDVIINGAISNGDFNSYNNNKEQRYTRWKDQADVIICMLGTNDGAYGPGESLNWLYTDYKQHLSDAVKEWKADGKTVVLRVPPKIVNQAHAGHIGRNDDIHRWVKEVAEEQGCILVDHFDLFDEKQKSDEKSITSTGFWFNHTSTKDGIHPVGPGQIAMAKQVIEEMGIYDSNSRVARQDMAEPVTKSESIKNTKLVLNKESKTISYNLAALEAELGKTIGEAELTVTQGTTTISKKLVRKEAASLGSISVDVKALSGTVQAQLTVRTTDAWNGSSYADLVVAKETLDLETAASDYDLTELQSAYDDAQALLNEQNSLLPGAWINYLNTKAAAGKAALEDPSGTFSSQAEVDDSASRLDYAVLLARTISNAYKALDADKDLDPDLYTDSTRQAYLDAKSALSTALTNSLADPDYTSQMEVNGLLETYKSKRNALELAPAPTPTVDTAALRMVLTDIGEIDLSVYTNPSGLQTKFTAALSEGKAALTSDSQTEVDQAASTLNRLWLQMRLKPSGQKLAELKQLSE